MTIDGDKIEAECGGSLVMISWVLGPILRENVDNFCDDSATKLAETNIETLKKSKQKK